MMSLTSHALVAQLPYRWKHNTTHFVCTCVCTKAHTDTLDVDAREENPRGLKLRTKLEGNRGVRFKK